MNALIFSAIWGIVMMFSGVFLKEKSHSRGFAILGAVLLLALNTLEMGGMVFFHPSLNGMLSFDRTALLFTEVAIGCTLIHLLLSSKEIYAIGVNGAEYFALIFFVLCGITLTSSFNNLLVLFIGIEIVSIPLYILTGSDKRNLKSNEAALKYFLMGSFSTGIMLMGIALLYGASPNGSFYIDQLGISAGQFQVLSAVGLLLLLVAMSFKASAAPFHFWTPDAYDGAPTAITAFMATVVKAAVFIAFIRLFGSGFGVVHEKWKTLVAILTAATLVIGNFTAVFQSSVKRMLAYSSIAQAGFMLLAIYALSGEATEGLLLYALSYSLATIGIFAVLNKMDDYTIDGFNGLGKAQPLIAFTLTVFLFSLAGIPATAGFMAKYYMLMSASASGGSLWLIITAICCAAVSVYYYFRVVQAMYFKEGNPTLRNNTDAFQWLLSIVALLLLVLGLFPHYFTNWIYFDMF